jgi:regulator of replication initiation timing
VVLTKTIVFIFCFHLIQQAQKHVENTLKEMMDQKNKLAYENGRLQTQVEQATIELESLRKTDLEVTKYKQISEALASKYSQVGGDTRFQFTYTCSFHST